MKSVLLVVLSLLSVVRSADTRGLLYVRRGDKDYVPCRRAPVAYHTTTHRPVPYPALFFFFFFASSWLRDLVGWKV
jgi:hypothetical protein